MDKTVTHHIHYKEIHGFDETVMMTKSDHVKLHRRLRRENECDIPAVELHKISQAACRRAHPEVVRERNKKYRELHHDEILIWKKRYREEHREELAAKQRIYMAKKKSMEMV